MLMERLAGVARLTCILLAAMKCTRPIDSARSLLRLIPSWCSIGSTLNLDTEAIAKVSAGLEITRPLVESTLDRFDSSSRHVNVAARLTIEEYVSKAVDSLRDITRGSLTTIRGRDTARIFPRLRPSPRNNKCNATDDK